MSSDAVSDSCCTERALEPSAVAFESLTGAARFFDKTTDLSAIVATLPTLVAAVSV